MHILKSVLAVILSIAAAILLFIVIEGVSSILHPWPEDFAGTFEEISRQVETYPAWVLALLGGVGYCLLYTSPSPRDQRGSRMPSSA